MNKHINMWRLKLSTDDEIVISDSASMPDSKVFTLYRMSKHVATFVVPSNLVWAVESALKQKGKQKQA